MIELVMVYCLAADPVQCREQRVPLPSAAPMACMVAGQQQAQQYVWEHPKYRLARWRCEINLPRQLPA